MTIFLARADARALPLKDGCVQCVITSPPYWGLRDYGTPAQIGNESTPTEYVAHIVATMREVRRVLRDDGTLWLNLGDGYASTPKGNPDALSNGLTNKGRNAQKANSHRTKSTICDGLKPKDLVGIPWSVAFALRDDGWYLRRDIIWAKSISFCPSYSGACMPESCTDRPTTSHEYVFLFSKRADYLYDLEAVKEATANPNRGPRHDRFGGNKHGEDTTKHSDGSIWEGDVSRGRNLRSVWTINPHPYKGAHYATFPEALVEPMIRAGTSQHGACAACGAPWERVIECDEASPNIEPPQLDRLGTGEVGTQVDASSPRTVDWKPTCVCGTDEVLPCVVLDPFCGTGTVGRVAVRLRRRAVCCDLSDTYLRDLATKRTSNVQIELIA